MSLPCASACQAEEHLAKESDGRLLSLGTLCAVTIQLAAALIPSSSLSGMVSNRASLASAAFSRSEGGSRVFFVKSCKHQLFDKQAPQGHPQMLTLWSWNLLHGFQLRILAVGTVGSAVRPRSRPHFRGRNSEGCHPAARARLRTGCRARGAPLTDGAQPAQGQWFVHGDSPACDGGAGFRASVAPSIDNDIAIAES